MKFSELKAELDSGKKRNLYIFTGPEKEVMLRYVKRISEKPSKAKSIDEIIPRLTVKNLFASTQTFLIEDDKGASEMDYKALQKTIGKNTVILIFKDIDKRKKLFKAAEKDIVEFKKFEDFELVFFVNKTIQVPDELAMMIARFCGNDVARIENECQKLALLGQDITEELVKDLIHPPVEDRIFDMIDMVAKKKREGVFNIYYDLLELKTSPIQMVGLLYTKFKHLFLVQSYFNLQNAELAGKTGLTFFQVNIARQLVGAFTVEEILSFMQKIQKVEVDIKTGQVDQFVGMENLLVEILK
jgi:DNA polymerase III delta subunit